MATETKAPTNNRSGRITVMEAARRLKVRYQKARDLMLTGKLGETQYEGRRLTCSEAGLQEYVIQKRLRKR